MSAVFLTIFVVASLSIRVQSFPEGCVKMIGSPSKGSPGEFFVKVNPNSRTATVVKIMLELSNSACEEKLWRSSNTTDAVMEPMTCSDMLFMDGYGFFAKMSNAAAMWVSEHATHSQSFSHFARLSGAIICMNHGVKIHKMFFGCRTI